LKIKQCYAKLLSEYTTAKEDIKNFKKNFTDINLLITKLLYSKDKELMARAIPLVCS